QMSSIGIVVTSAIVPPQSDVQRQLKIPSATIKITHACCGIAVALEGLRPLPWGTGGEKSPEGISGGINGVELSQLGGVWGGSPMIRAGIIVLAVSMLSPPPS